jgi:heterodisulfide reductase subunit A
MVTKGQNVNNVLVVGGGIGGIKAALELAEMGYHVYLQDKAPVLGGTFLQLDKQFPTNDCGMCKILPVFGSDINSETCIRRGLEHVNITELTNSNVVKLEGKVGKFKVTVAKNPEVVDHTKCIDCGKCVEVCPVDVEDEFNSKLSTRKAIYLACPVSSLGRYVVDLENCTQCKKCVKICPTSAVDLDAKEQMEALEVGAVVLAPGFELFDAKLKKEYGYSEYPNVLTSIEFERILSGIGPYSGIRELVRPSDKEVPKSIGFIQCVGSRDQVIEKDYCSSACCMISLKEAMMVKELYPDTEVDIYFMDMRAFGKGYHLYYEQAKAMGINFIRNRPAAVEEDDENQNLIIEYVTESGEPKKDELDLVVLAVGLGPPKTARELSQTFNLDLDEFGFCQANDFSRLETSQPGVFVCGGFSGPKDIPDTITEAIAVAGKGAGGMARPEPETVHSDEPAEDEVPIIHVDMTEDVDEPRLGIFICDCGGEIGDVVDLDLIINELHELEGVVAAEKVDYLCINPEILKTKLSESKVNRVILGACAAYNYGTTFNKILMDAGLNPAMLEIVNLREQLAWTHKNEPEQATARAQSQLEIAMDKLHRQDYLEVRSVKINSEILVLGAGLAGITAALTAVKAGNKVHLVEKSDKLGGHLQEIYRTLDGKDVQELLKNLISEIEENENITLHLNTELKTLEGSFGNFNSTVVTGGDEQTIHHGALIIATGAAEYKTDEYLFGQDDRVVTQLQLEKILAGEQGAGNGEQNVPAPSSQLPAPKLNNIVMLQCVGSRSIDHPYCSRVCCSIALINAIRLKEQNPDVKIYILYQDIMSYGLMEKYYSEARRIGIKFMRYEPDKPPVVKAGKKALNVKLKDILMDQIITLEPDLLVLTTGIIPENENIANMLDGSELMTEGFFHEANVKFRPVELLRDGIFVCGLAHSPRLIEESMAQATAAAGKAIAVLSKPEIYARRKVSEVLARFCAGCGACVDACPYQARIMEPEEKVAVVLEPLCQGCGTCVSVCPSGAAKLRGYKEMQILDMIDTALED